MGGFWTLVRTGGDGRPSVYRNGSRTIETYCFGPPMTPEQMEKFNQIKERYFKAIDNGTYE